jgi:hypothetical protein
MTLRSLPVVIVFLFSTLVLSAQSLDKKAPAPLQSGVNTGSVDSLIGAHYFYFWAESGSFTLTCGQGGAEGLGASGRAKCLSGLSPATPGAVMTVKSSPSQDVYSGSVKVRTRVGIAVQPPNSPLVRSTVGYSLTASGNVTFDSAEATGPPIAGMYNTMYNNPLGAVRFKADGTIEASNGQTGTWKLFDKATATYVVIIDGKRMTLHLDLGRGLIDIQTNLIPFSKAH